MHRAIVTTAVCSLLPFLFLKPNTPNRLTCKDVFLIFKDLFYFMCECFTCMGACMPGQKRSSDRLEQIDGCDPFVSVGNWTWILCKSSKCSYPLSPRKDAFVSLTHSAESPVTGWLLLSLGAASSICSVECRWGFEPRLVGFFVGLVLTFTQCVLVRFTHLAATLPRLIPLPYPFSFLSSF